MAAAKRHETFGAKALNVLALPDLDGWLYFVEVVELRFGRDVRTRAVGPIPYPSAVSALAQGMAYARALASAGEAEDSASDELQATLAW